MKKKKRALTLLEIMIVIVLIGLIGSVIGVNMKGSLEEGKAFKTRQAQEQIADILMLEVARGSSIDEIIGDPGKFLELSGLVKNGKTFCKDGWGEIFEIKKAPGDKIVVKSSRLKKYETKRNQKLGRPNQVEEVDED